MRLNLGILAASALTLGLGGCVTDGYGFGSSLGLGSGYGAPYGSPYGAAYAPGYGDGSGYRTCIRRERVWDPYTRRTITVRHRYAC